MKVLYIACWSVVGLAVAGLFTILVLYAFWGIEVGANPPAVVSLCFFVAGGGYFAASILQDTWDRQITRPAHYGSYYTLDVGDRLIRIDRDNLKDIADKEDD